MSQDLRSAVERLLRMYEDDMYQLLARCNRAPWQLYQWEDLKRLRKTVEDLRDVLAGR